MADIEIDRLQIGSTLGCLHLFDTQIEISEKVSRLAEILKSDCRTPGIILMNAGEFHGMISRRTFYELMSQPYSLDLYHNREVEFLYEEKQTTGILVLHETEQIAGAAMISLQRQADLIYEPVIVRLSDRHYKVLDIHHLLMAQSKIHLLTVKSLEEANEFKSEVLGIASHDLKNPLNSILGFSKMIRDEMIRVIPDISQIVEYADMIFNSSQRMLQLIIKLLDSSAVEAAKAQLEKSDVDLVKMVQDIITLNIATARKKYQTIEFSHSFADSAVISADAPRLSTAIENIINNAVKYSPLKGNIKISMTEMQRRIFLEVSDQGAGIKDDELSRLFGKFSKLSSRPTGGESSTGLGLYIAKQTVALHGGDIKVRSKYGKGTTFTIELPLDDSHGGDIL